MNSVVSLFFRPRPASFLKIIISLSAAFVYADDEWRASNFLSFTSKVRFVSFFDVGVLKNFPQSPL